MFSVTNQSKIVYLIVAWMIVNIVLVISLLPNDYMDLNNWIELGLWIGSTGGLLSMRKWGAALALFTLIYTFSTSISILIYYQIWLNALRVIINSGVIVYMFKMMFAGKFR